METPIEQMNEAELRSAIAEEIYGWKPARIGPDIEGKNEGEVLTPNGELIKGFAYPPRGKVHRGYHFPRFSGDMSRAICLAKMVGLQMTVSELPSDPVEIARLCLAAHRAAKTLNS